MGKITKRAVDALASDPAKPVFLWDDGLSGFGVKCLPTGAKRYVVKYRANGGGRTAPQRWLALGTHGQLTPDQARKLAQEALAAVARGEDPQGRKLQRRAAYTLTDLWERFRLEHLPSKKPQTRYDYEGQWRGVLGPKLGKVAVEQLARSDVDRLHKALRPTPYRANRVLALLSRLMTLAEVWGIRFPGSNPCRHVEKFKEIPRNRFLRAVEMESLGEAMRSMVATGELSSSAANAVRLLLLTGARLSEVLGAEWAWIDYDQRVIALPDSKTGAKPIFLSDAALAVLQDQTDQTSPGRFVFPGESSRGTMVNLRKPWMRICARAGLEGVRLHDLRHTAASVAVGIGASLPVIGRLLGHSQAQTTQRYAHVDAEPALHAANAIGQAMSSIWQSSTGTTKV